MLRGMGDLLGARLELLVREGIFIGKFPSRFFNVVNVFFGLSQFDSKLNRGGQVF
jgi:hypothetical protein